MSGRLFGRRLSLNAVGRHRLRPTISPGKTWEGTLGALGGAVAEMIADSARRMRTTMADRVLDLPRETLR
jgi:predicted CDP-diglyceride synthetase/phosphatidate cytidylyltransferase